MSFPKWSLAFDFYAVASEATGQWTYAAAMGHKLVCNQLAMKSYLKNRKQSIAVLYDEAVRKQWASRAYDGDASLDIVDESPTLNEEMLKQAEDKYDEIFSNSKGKGKGKGLSWSYGAKGFPAAQKRPWLDSSSEGKWGQDFGKGSKRRQL